MIDLINQDFVQPLESGKTSRSWIFTLNNYTQNEMNAIAAFECTRRCVGKELGENGTPHLQGFITFKKAYRLAGMKKLMPRAHLQITKSAMHAWNYCCKEGDLFVCENFCSPGKRTDSEKYRDAIKSGYSDRMLADTYPHEFLRFCAGTTRMRNAYLEARTEMTKCIWIHGHPGSGKSTYIKEKYPNADWVEYDGKYFSRFENLSVVIFDDQNMELIDESLFLKLVNHTPYKARVMRDFQEWNPKLIIICSNIHPEQWRVPQGRDGVVWPYENAAVRRRITEIVKYDYRDVTGGPSIT